MRESAAQPYRHFENIKRNQFRVYVPWIVLLLSVIAMYAAAESVAWRSTTRATG